MRHQEFTQAFKDFFKPRRKTPNTSSTVYTLKEVFEYYTDEYISEKDFIKVAENAGFTCSTLNEKKYLNFSQKDFDNFKREVDKVVSQRDMANLYQGLHCEAAERYDGAIYFTDGMWLHPDGSITDDD
jgi:hypothetical protein